MIDEKTEIESEIEPEVESESESEAEAEIVTEEDIGNDESNSEGKIDDDSDSAATPEEIAEVVDMLREYMAYKRRINRIIWGVILVLVIIGIIVGIIQWNKFYNSLRVFDTKTIELGSEVDNDISHYMNHTDEWILRKATLDTTMVDNMKSGTYQAVVHALYQDFLYEIIVEDTTPPTLETEFREYVKVGEPIVCSDIKSIANDLSGMVTVELAIPKDDLYIVVDEFIPENLGDSSVIIVATDINGNVTTSREDFVVENSPFLIGNKDINLVVGTDFDISNYLVVYDDNDGINADSITITSDGFDTNEIGSYVVNYAVTNSHDLLTYESGTINVVDAKDYKENHVSSDDMTSLIDIGYFNYEPLENEDIKEASELVAPCLVNLYTDKLIVEGYSGSKSGSGIIYSIEDDYIYISTNNHVLSDWGRWSDTMQIFTYEGNIFDYHQVDDYVKDENIDIAMFKIPVDLSPTEELLKLKQVYMEPNYDETLEASTKIFAYSPQWNGGKKSYLKDGVLLDETVLPGDVTSTIKEEFNYSFDDWFFGTYNSYHGMSGTGVFDYTGKLIGTVTIYAYVDNYTFSGGVDNEFLPKLYEKIKGE